MDDGVKKSFIKYNYELFAHHLYELDKGLRHLVLHTAPIEVVDDMIRKLKKNDVPFHIQELSCGKINLFFGERECVETIKKFKNKKQSCPNIYPPTIPANHMIANSIRNSILIILPTCFFSRPKIP